MREITLKVAAGRVEEIAQDGDYVRIKSAGVPVRIEADAGQVDATIEQGDALNLLPFKRLRVSHTDISEQTVILLIGNGTSADGAKVGGTVAVSGDVSSIQKPYQTAIVSFTGAVAVTNASTILRGANANRRFLAVQNKSTSGTIWLAANAGPATFGNGIKIGPGDYYEYPPHYVPTGQINAIGDIANNPDVLVIDV